MAPFILRQLTIGHFSGVIGIPHGYEEMSQTWRPCHLCCITPHPAHPPVSGFKSSCCIFWSAANRCFPGHHRVNISYSMSPVLAIWQVGELFVGKVWTLCLHHTREIQDIYHGFQNHMTTVCANDAILIDWQKCLLYVSHLKICSVDSGVCVCVWEEV